MQIIDVYTGKYYAINIRGGVYVGNIRFYEYEAYVTYFGKVCMKMVKLLSDLRVQRTLTSIRAAFEELLGETSFEAITISALTRRAGVNRRTFYLHYKNLGDVLKEFCTDVAESYIQATHHMDGRTDYAAICREFMLFFATQGPLIEKIICSDNYRLISDTINDRIASRNRGHVDPSDNIDPYVRELVIAFLRGGSLNIIRRWVQDGKHVPLEDMVDLGVQLICRGIENYMAGVVNMAKGARR